VTVLGYGAVFINGSYPEPLHTPGFPNCFTADVTRPAPLGVQKFAWNTKTHQFDKAWNNHEIDNFDIMIPGCFGQNRPALLRQQAER
jgi:hypothetical protein